ncbi:MAG: YafY family transcriptional regulator [Ktedonobacteraceae bacterium]|nr:YafY family transcriptional regulator [Ktedonobacteraceae bacterium]
MSRTDRLLAIVLELQAHGRRRAEDLAATFETSKRTIYRDIQALSESGVPVVSVPGQGYSLMKGYFLPPLSFTTEEACMLLLGSDFMSRNFDAQYAEAARSAHRKIESILPEKLRDDVRYLQENIQFVVAGNANNPHEQEKLQQLRRAIIERRTVHFRYSARHTQESDNTSTERDVDPYSLVFLRNNWLLVAYCHLRQGIRNFRLNRMDDLVLLERTFQRSDNFLVYDPEREQPREMPVRILFDPEVARWVREMRPFYTVGEEETDEGLLLTLRIRQESDIMQWLLGWGRHARVLEPDSLRLRLVEEAKAIQRTHERCE